MDFQNIFFLVMFGLYLIIHIYNTNYVRIRIPLFRRKVFILFLFAIDIFVYKPADYFSLGMKKEAT
jgi:hypothetical protein